jgi:CelD/BcsL family acetyltransferase involved in cellulose biosynthesis
VEPTGPGLLWKPTSLRLELQVGEVHLLDLAAPGLACESAPPEPGAHGREPAPPAELLDGRADAAVLRSLPVEHPLPRLSLIAGLIRYVPAQYRRYYVALGSGTFAQYLEGFSPRSRSTLRRKLRRCAEAHPDGMAFREYRTPEEMERFLEVAPALSMLTYQERLLDKGLPHDERFREELRRLAAAGEVRGYVLFLGGRPAAYLLCPLRQGCVFYEWLGYDPAFASLSPGTVLQYLALERLFAEGCHRRFDFTEGEGEHKEFWARGYSRCADVFYFRPSPRHVAMVGCHAAFQGLSRAAVRVLDLLGWKARVKRAIRALA